MDVEATFAVEVPEADARRLATVGELYDYVAGALNLSRPRSAAGPYEGELWERYLDLVERETGVARRRLKASARFVRDLGID